MSRLFITHSTVRHNGSTIHRIILVKAYSETLAADKMLQWQNAVLPNEPSITIDKVKEVSWSNPIVEFLRSEFDQDLAIVS